MDAKVLRYTIKVVIDIPASDPTAISRINEVLDKGKEYGSATVASVQVVKAEKEV